MARRGSPIMKFIISLAALDETSQRVLMHGAQVLANLITADEWLANLEDWAGEWPAPSTGLPR